jgi:hypothetical protein
MGVYEALGGALRPVWSVGGDEFCEVAMKSRRFRGLQGSSGVFRGLQGWGFQRFRGEFQVFKGLRGLRGLRGCDRWGFRGWRPHWSGSFDGACGAVRGKGNDGPRRGRGVRGLRSPWGDPIPRVG